MEEMIEKQNSKKVKHRSIWPKFHSIEFNNASPLQGILRHLTLHHIVQQNGVKEMMNWTLMEKVRCMISNSEFLKHFGLKLFLRLIFTVHPQLLLRKKIPKEV